MSAMSSMSWLVRATLMVLCLTACGETSPRTQPGSAAPVGAPPAILSLSDEERKAQGRPVLPTRYANYRIGLSKRFDLVIRVPAEWDSSPLKAVGEDRLFRNEQQDVILEIETERWEGDAFAWVSESDATGRLTLPGYQSLDVSAEEDPPAGLAGASVATRSFLYRHDGVAEQAKDLAVTAPGSDTVMYLRLEARAEDYALMQRVWGEAYRTMRLVPSR
jgi:hypothetical protein